MKGEEDREIRRKGEKRKEKEEAGEELRYSCLLQVERSEGHKGGERGRSERGMIKGQGSTGDERRYRESEG